MSRLIYLHGFQSSPHSFKARWLRDRLTQLGCADRYYCPQLPASPRQAIDDVIKLLAPQSIDTLIGSSLGGFYATWLAEQVGCRAVLLNPAIRPAASLGAHIGVQSMFHHHDQSFEFRAEYLDELRAFNVSVITRPDRYLLIAATGDTVLDWREMVAHYPGTHQRVIQGSDHGLSDFEHYGDDVLQFSGLFPAAFASVR